MMKVRIKLIYIRERRREFANLIALMVVIVFLLGLVAPFDLDPPASFRFKNIRPPKRLIILLIFLRAMITFRPGSPYSLVKSFLLVDMIFK